MSRTVVDMSPDHAKLLFGGTLLAAGDRAERATLAQVDLKVNTIDFSREFELVDSILAI